MYDFDSFFSICCGSILKADRYYVVGDYGKIKVKDVICRLKFADEGLLSSKGGWGGCVIAARYSEIF